MTTAHAPTARSREKPSGDEEATTNLKLGEFEGVPTLSFSEARVLINAVMNNRRSKQNVEEHEYVELHQDVAASTGFLQTCGGWGSS